MKKLLIVLILLSLIVACTPRVKEEVVSDVPSENSEAFNFLDSQVMFVKDEAVDLLASEDDYISQFSTFDWMSKFKSEVPLTFEERRELYGKSLLQWNKGEIDRIEAVLLEVEPLLLDFTFEMPDELWFIKENGNVEGGAAYTRANAIIFPERFLNGIDDESLKYLVLHELFHVVSRHNKDLRPELYGIINYKQCEPLVLEGALGDLTIANPDAPDMNYYIECMFKGEVVSFIPIIYSKEAYDLEENESFFMYLNDDMLAVDFIDGVPVPLLDSGKEVIVKKDDLDNYYDLIGRNTHYTYHPEETMADNFVLMALGDDSVPNPEILEKMRTILKK